MLIGARDEDGRAEVHDPETESDMRLTPSGKWVSGGCRVSIDSNGVIEEFLCRGIPSGEKRVIDLEKSVIVHVAPKKTAVEELVEASQNFYDGLFPDGGRRVGLTEFERRSHALESALARVRQEQQEKGGTP